MSEALDQTQEGHGGGSLLGFLAIDGMVKRWFIQSQPRGTGESVLRSSVVILADTDTEGDPYAVFS